MKFIIKNIKGDNNNTSSQTQPLVIPNKIPDSLLQDAFKSTRSFH